MPRLLSVVHPALAGFAHLPRYHALDGFDVTLVLPDTASLEESGRTRIVRLPARGGVGRSARYEGLAQLITRHVPDVLHIHARPDSSLAVEAAGLRGTVPRPSVVLECEHRDCAPGPWHLRLRAQRLLGQVDAVIARHFDGINHLRAAGFEGLGVVGAAGVTPCVLPSQADARNALGMDGWTGLVFGIVGPLEQSSGVLDVLEAVAACPHDVAAVMVGTGRLRTELLDRAAALEIGHRLYLVDPSEAAPGRSIPLDVLGAADAMIVAPHQSGAASSPHDRVIEMAQAHGVPVICVAVPGLPDVAGAGGWLLPPEDPAVLSHLLHRLCLEPARIDAASIEASQQAVRRHGAEASGAALCRAVTAAQSGAAQRGRRAMVRRGGNVLGRQIDL